MTIAAEISVVGTSWRFSSRMIRTSPISVLCGHARNFTTACTTWRGSPAPLRRHSPMSRGMCCRYADFRMVNRSGQVDTPSIPPMQRWQRLAVKYARRNFFLTSKTAAIIPLTFGKKQSSTSKPRETLLNRDHDGRLVRLWCDVVMDGDLSSLSSCSVCGFAIATRMGRPLSLPCFS